MERRHSGSHRLGPKNSEWKNPLKMISPRFFGIKTATSSLIIFQRAELSARSITHLWWCTWRTFWRKHTAGSSPRASCSSTTLPRLTGHLQPRRNWPVWTSSVLITHPILWIWPVGLPPFSWTEKIIEKSSLFVRHEGHCCRGDLVRRTVYWFFVSGLQKLEQRAKKCIELHWEYVE
jgi:hypothetical protein